MKLLTLSLLTLGLSLSAQAGDVTKQFTCKNADGTVIITEKKMVLLEEDAIRSLHLHIFKALSTSMPMKDIALGFGSESEQLRKTDYVIVKELTDRKTTYEHRDKGGFGSDYKTESYTIAIDLALAGSNYVAMNLFCLESTEISNK